MSIGTTHLVFISVASVLAALVASWGTRVFLLEGRASALVLALVAATSLVALVRYGLRVRRKLRGTSL